MKSIKVFIASSDELKFERLVFADLIVHLNKLFKPRGFEIDPEKWEWLDASMGPKRKQEEYNDVIKTCDICLVLFWTRFGDYTAEELDTAYNELCAGRKPTKIYVYFKEGTPVSADLQSFKESFDAQYGHFYCRFENTDTLNLNFLLQIERFYNDTMNNEPLLEVHDSKVMIEGKAVADLHEVPFAGNNPEYLQTLKDIEKLQAKVLKYPDDDDFRQELHDLLERRKRLEESLLDTAKLITRLSTESSSARLQEAIRLFETGDNKGANAVLNLKEISADASMNAQRIDQARVIEQEAIRALESNIEEYRLKIKALQNSMEEGWLAEVLQVYADATEYARGRITPIKFADWLHDYAFFLVQNAQYHLVGSLYEEALAIYRQQPENNERNLNILLALNNIASLQDKRHEYDLAEQTYQQALEIARSLASNDPDMYDAAVAMMLCNLASLHKTTEQYELAEEESQEAYNIYISLDERFAERYYPELSTLLNNMGNLYKDLDRHDSAEECFQLSIDLLREMGKTNPAAVEAEIARTLHNCSVLHRTVGAYELAEQELQEALEIRRRLAEANPEAHNKDIGLILNSLGLLHHDAQQYSLAEKEYQEALAIFRHLADKNPEVFEQDISMVLTTLSMTHRQLRQYELAERELQEALEIDRRWAEKNPDAHTPKLCDTLHNLALLYDTTRQYPLARQTYQEALAIRRQLAQKNPEVHNGSLASTLNNLGSVYHDLGAYEQAKEAYQEALEILQRLTEKNPEVYDEDLAMTRNNLAVLYSDMEQSELAVEEFQHVLEIFRRLAEKNPAHYDQTLAIVCSNLGYKYYQVNNLQAAEKSYEESLEIYRRLEAQTPGLYEGEIANALYMLGFIHLTHNKAQAKTAFVESLEIYRRIGWQERVTEIEGLLTEYCD